MTALENSILADRYFLKKLAGAGGMGQVYQAWDRERSAYMAIKVIHDARFIESFIREAVALKELAHPNIVRFYSVEKDEKKGIAFIVMDWVDGKDLNRILKERKRPMTLGEVAKYLDGVQKALHYAHSKGVCHCDIKPGNILIRNSDGYSTLSDFGLAHVNEDKGGGGTLAFMAPELLQGGKISVASDIYALGVTLYQLLSNQLPFTGPAREQLIQGHLYEKPVPIQKLNLNIPIGIASIVEQALAKNPGERQSTVTELWLDFIRHANTPKDRGNTSTTHENKPQTPVSIILYDKKEKRESFVIEVGEKEISIGRSTKNRIHLRHPSVSLEHAVIIYRKGFFYITDVGSTNGTYVNHELIPAHEMIKIPDGASVQFGNKDAFEFQIKFKKEETSKEVVADHESVEKVPDSVPPPFANTDSGTILNILDKGDSERFQKLLVQMGKDYEFPKDSTDASNSQSNMGSKEVSNNSSFIPKEIREDILVPVKQHKKLDLDPKSWHEAKEFGDFFDVLASNSKGTFCVAGFQGVGRISFVNQVISDLETKINKEQKQIFVKINNRHLSAGASAKSILHLLIRSLNDELTNMGLFDSLEKNLAEDIRQASKKTSATLEEQKVMSKGGDGGIGIGVDGIASGKLGAEKKIQDGIKYTHHEYDIESAGGDLVSILARLNKLSISIKFKKMNIRVLFVLVVDEPANMEDGAVFEGTIKSLKTFFADFEASIVFVIGKDQYAYLTTSMFDSISALNIVSSRARMYLPCQWDLAHNVLNEAADFQNFNGQIGVADAKLVFGDFIKYVSYRSRGLPEKFINIMKEEKFLGKDNSTIIVPRQSVRSIRFYAGLYSWLQKWISANEPMKLEKKIQDIDYFRWGVFELVQIILFLGEREISIQDIISELEKHRKWLLAYLGEDILLRLLNDLCAAEYLVKNMDMYIIDERRYREIRDSDGNVGLLDASRHDAWIINLKRMRKPNSDVSFMSITQTFYSDHSAVPFSAKDCQLMLECVNEIVILKPLVNSGQKLFSLATNWQNGKLSIGSSPKNDLQLLLEYVSGFHATLFYTGNIWEIFVNNNENEITYVNNKLIRKHQPLSNGDIIQIGSIGILFVSDTFIRT